MPSFALKENLEQYMNDVLAINDLHVEVAGKQILKGVTLSIRQGKSTP